MFAEFTFGTTRGVASGNLFIVESWSHRKSSDKQSLLCLNYEVLSTREVLLVSG